MHADPKGVLTGTHFIDGDHAACEGALAAGCRFVAGYPITPSTEVVERFAQRIPLVGGVFIQILDEECRQRGMALTMPGIKAYEARRAVATVVGLVEEGSSP